MGFLLFSLQNLSGIFGHIQIINLKSYIINHKSVQFLILDKQIKKLKLNYRLVRQIRR